MVTRRGFLTAALAAGAAALGLPGTAAKAETAHDPWCPCRFDMSPAAVERLKSATKEERIRYPGDTDLSRQCVTCGWHTPWTNETSTLAAAMREWEAMEAHNRAFHGGVEQRTHGMWRRHQPLTFEAMQADCEARGCRFEVRAPYYLDGEPGLIKTGHTAWGMIAHNNLKRPFLWGQRDHPDMLLKIDAWRTALHESGG